MLSRADGFRPDLHAGRCVLGGDHARLAILAPVDNMSFEITSAGLALLFNGSLKSNIAYGSLADADPALVDRIFAAAKKAKSGQADEDKKDEDKEAEGD